MTWVQEVVRPDVRRDWIVGLLGRANAVCVRDLEPRHRAARSWVWRLPTGSEVLLLEDHELGLRVIGHRAPRPAIVRVVPVVALSELVAQVRGGAPTERLFATRALAAAADGWRDGVPAAIAAALGDPEEAVRRAAVRVVTRRGWAEAAPLLREVGGRDRAMREVVGSALRGLSEPVLQGAGAGPNW